MATIKLTDKVQVIVEVEDKGAVVFRDALYLTPEERAAANDEDLQAAGQARYDAHLAIVKAPPREPTEAEKDDSIAFLLIQKSEAEAKLATVPPEKIDQIKRDRGILLAVAPRDEEQLVVNGRGG